jgi:endonuclease/exonuclease/phosphatase (EEP) superfamily protein YafD
MVTAGVVTAVLVAPFAGWAVVRLFGLERGWPVVPLLAFTPYACVLSVPPVLTALALRQWAVAAVGALATLALAGCVLPRAVGRPDPPAAGPHLRVLTSNLLFGAAAPEELLELVRAKSVDVLALQEYTAQADKALRAAGLDLLLPHRVTEPLEVPGGSALYSRFPLEATGYRWLPPSSGQCYATVRVPEVGELMVESVHPSAPSAVRVLKDWRFGLHEQPSAGAGPLRLLLGDFNATLDHAPLRDLLRRGYRDAAAVLGAGLAATWPYDGRRIPPVTIDHVLADARMAVHEVSVHRLTGTDHRALFALLSLPRSGPPGD